MSFGFSVGDFLAVIHAIKRVAEEVQSYKNAPRHFQQLGAELRLLQSTLQCVLDIQVTELIQKASLDRIRMIAMHCRQPLQAFIEKMRPKETSLGHFRSAGTASAIGTRLHWSLIAKKDVEDLRKVIVSEMVAINVLLGVQQLTNLNILSKESTGFQKDAREYFLNSTALLTKSVEILHDIKTLPQEIQTLRELAIDNVSKQDISHGKLLQGVSGLLLENARNIGDQVAKSVAAVVSLAANIKRLLKLLATFSNAVLRQIDANTKMLLDMNANIKRILRAIEAIPLHLTLDIVRFDDALGESWALPFQACAQWNAFNEILYTVVFKTQPPGFFQLASQRFMILLAKDNSELLPGSWKNSVKPGAHLLQSVKFSSEQSTGDRCPFPSCNERLTTKHVSGQGYICPKCDRWSGSRRTEINILQFVRRRETKFPPSRLRQARPPIFEGFPLPAVQGFEININLFRRIHITENVNPIKNLKEAQLLLNKDPDNARALRFVAWFNYPHRNNIQEPPNVESLENVINLLTRSKNSASHDSQTWYLLARAYMDTQRYPDAHECYQQAVYRAGDLPGYWVSIGLLFFAVNQFRDSRGGFSRSIRLNPYISEAWYNLAVLYETVAQPVDALECYQRYLELEQNPDPAVLLRVAVLRQIVANNTIYHEVPLPMKDIDLRSSLNQPQQVEHEEDIQIAGLNFSESLDIEEAWETDSDEDGEYPHGVDDDGGSSHGDEDALV